MAIGIFGRERELALLMRLVKSNKPEFLAIYGRRRVGKTYLIHEFFKNKGRYFYFTGTKFSSKQNQIGNFYRKLNQQFEPSGPLPKEWNEALYQLYVTISQIPLEEKVILFFDELPWLASNRSGFLQALEYAWNQYFTQMNNVILIVCGSAAAWIIKKIINNKRGLYGRLTEIIKLNPFSLGEVDAFLQSQHIQLSQKHLVELYMALGGVAKYLTFIRPGESPAQLINRLCFMPQGQLVGEFNNLYESLFDHASKHIDMVKSLASKREGRTIKALLEDVGMTSGGTSTAILEELEESGFISSFQQFHKKSKDKQLRLVDEYSYFYLTWIDPIRKAILRESDTDYWLKMQSTPRWSSWSGYAFESICLKHIRQIKQALGIAGVLTHEYQWSYVNKKNQDRGAQIDLIIERQDNCINLCEIKFSETPFVITQDYSHQLKQKIMIFREKTKTRKTIFLTCVLKKSWRTSSSHAITLAYAFS